MQIKLYLWVALFFCTLQICNAQQNNVEALLKENAFIKVEVSKQKCFVGEPILVRYMFYRALPVKSKVIKMPVFTGCSVQEMTTTDNFMEHVKLNGKNFEVIEIRKVQVIPLVAGNITLDTAAVENVLIEEKLKEYSFEIFSKPIIITAIDLPKENVPQNFQNNVGNFTVETTISATNFQANTTQHLTITIEGEGNFSNIVCPKIAFPENVESFDIAENSMINKMSFPNKGSVVFSIPFMVKKQGSYSLPVVDFSFFSTNTNTYQIVQSKPISFSVVGFAKTNIGADEIKEDITNKKYLWIIPAFAIVASMGLWLMFKSRKPSTKKIIELAALRIEEDIKLQKNSAPFISKKDQFKEIEIIEDDTIFYKELKTFCEKLLAENNCCEEDKILLQQTIMQCNSYLYAINTSITKTALVEKIKGIL